MKHHLRFLAASLILAASCAVVAGAQTQSLASVVNSAGYSLVNPARTDVVPGGFVVANKKHASYNDPAAAFQSTGFSASVYSSTGSKSFSLAALVNGIAKMVGGGVSVSHSSQLTVKQIDASAQKIDPNIVIADSKVQGQLKKWLSDKKAAYKVYLVDSTLSTTNISISSGSSTDITAAFGTTLPTCPTTSGGTAGSGNTAASTTNPDSGTTTPPSQPASSTTKKAGTPANGTTSNPATPSGTLQACINGTSVVGLTTTKPLVFAASLRAVTLGDDGSLSVSAVSDIQNTKAGSHPVPIDWNPNHAKHRSSN